ncbi:MAG: ABC transporter substrate-binding protein [Nitrososphaerota archaeon]
MDIFPQKFKLLAAVIVIATVMVIAFAWLYFFQAPPQKPIETTSIITTPTKTEMPGKYGGELVVANIADVLRMDPMLITDVPTATIAYQIFDFLVRYNHETKQYEPGLAISWEASEDAKTWTFKLRKGVKFHDGTPFNAEAVKFTIDRVLDPQSKSPLSQDFRDNVESVEVVDEYTVVFHLKNPLASFLDRIIRNQGAMIVSPTAVKKYGDDFSNHPVGTGPFMFKEWIPGERVVLVKNPDYWGGAPIIDTLIFKPMPESAAQVAALQAGQVDVILSIPKESLEILEKDPNVLVLKMPGYTTFGIVFNCESEFFMDKRVRQALNYAIDKNEIVNALFKGMGVRIYSPLPSASWAYTEDVNKFEYNPEKAKALLEEVGWKPGPDGILEKDGKKFSFVCITQEGKEAEDLVTAVQSYLKKIGIDMKIQIFEYGTWVDMLVTHQFDAGYIWWAAGAGDPDHYFPFLFYSTGWANCGLYSNSKVDELIIKVSQTPSFEERKKLAAEAQKLIVDDVAWIHFYSKYTMVATKKTVGGVILTPSEGEIDFYKTYFTSPKGG